MSQSELHLVSEALARVIVTSIQNACGDSIKEDVRRQRLVTQNSVPTRIWDLLNTALYENAPLYNCTAETTKRGPWQMLLIFDPHSGLLFNIMRETRFKELCRCAPSKRKYHYLPCLTSALNQDLIAGEKQVQMEQVGEVDLDFDIVHKIVTSMLHDLRLSEDVVRHHALVLFMPPGLRCSLCGV